MTQVAVVSAEKAVSLLSVALYVNGQLIEVADPNYAEEAALEKRACNLASALKISVKEVCVEVPGRLNWAAIEVNLFNEGSLEPPETSDRLMRGFYRCPKCFAQWTRIDDMNAAMDCKNCGHEAVDAFSSADPGDSVDHPMVQRALAIQERQYPAPMEQGTYDVEVTRSSLSTITATVESAGPASAQEDAIKAAYDREFPSGSDASYDAESFTKHD
jgi:hypothetical protein